MKYRSNLVQGCLIPTTPSGEVLVFIAARPRVARVLSPSRATCLSTRQQQHSAAAVCPSSSASPPASLPLLPRLRQPGLLWLASCLPPCPSRLAPAGSASSGSPPARETSYFTVRGPFRRGAELRIWTYSLGRLFARKCVKKL